MADTELGKMEFDHVDRINNVDILSLVGWVDAGIRQFARATSATRYDTHQEDVSIVKAWLTKFEKDFRNFAGEPELFMQKASPKPKPVPQPPQDISIVQNTFLQHMVYQCSTMRTELLFCESAERINGFHPSFVTATMDPWIQKQKNTIGNAEDDLANPEQTWMEEADLQEPGVNPGEPR